MCKGNGSFFSFPKDDFFKLYLQTQLIFKNIGKKIFSILAAIIICGLGIRDFTIYGLDNKGKLKMGDIT
jgi:hypothetical protein